MNTITAIRPYAEMLYFLAGIGLLVVACFGLRQLRLLKEDIRTRNVRAAREKAIDASNQYMKEFIPMYEDLCQKMKKAGLSSYEGPVSDFAFDALPAPMREKAIQRAQIHTGSNAINILEAIAAHFTSGIADETVGFRIFGRSYCATVASNYDTLSLFHSHAKVTTPYYQNTVQLYRTWSARLSKEELKAARSELDKNIRSIAEERLDNIQPNI
jgi:hypothetical protein